ncbi:Rad3-related DNA helicase [Evansella caseinilytica]|uniref:Rad3-related DNA helicase n=1 Tax=Evansella caseinilytica TaxID=1503961 RepID=A0A1H3SXP1_9BACI|nr:ATP-dependent DNA helicase [Evansella caseinilytica]SDZ42331.1 Rad3-related DNA helicase [Evansella caseinilytica]
MNEEIRLSVRALVEYVFSSGSIDTAWQINNSALLDGVKTHQRVQSFYRDEDQKEVPLTCTVEYQGFLYQLEGRCDGILFRDDEVIIDEIKSASGGVAHIDADHSQVHWAQAKLYGYMYAKNERLHDISVQVTYADVGSEKLKASMKRFTFQELEGFTNGVLEEYTKLAAMKLAFARLKTASMKQLSFPFPHYRKGQRDLAVAAYKTIIDGKKLFVKAPTGIGKTISVIFPTVKAIGEGKINKLVYMTAKTIARTVAEEAFALLRENGLRMKVCTITAKDKVCFKEETICQKDYCEFADGYYDRINEAILDIYEHEDAFDRWTVEKYARKHTVCPFEFSLDLALLADGIICDYHYVFDPKVYLKRLAAESKNGYALLVDEAHNLVDRGRAMYSASLSKSLFLNVKRLYAAKVAGIARAAGDINAYILAVKKEKLTEAYATCKDKLEELSVLLRRFLEESEDFLLRGQKDDAYESLLEAYFTANAYLKIAKLYDDNYLTYLERHKSEVTVKILCLHPAANLREFMKTYRAAIFFSATLIPGNYYKEMLGGDKEDYTLSLSSPFPRENLELYVVPVSTRYKDRERTFQTIIDAVYSNILSRSGNFLIFFPSYQYMNAVFERFTEQHPDVPVSAQDPAMSEADRDRFLQRFSADNSGSLLGFAVLGGIFSEGIDLKGDRLVGVFVVGVGLPQLNTEQEILKEHFRSSGKNGYDYAYVYPGMCKVLQAGGRLIRTETDKGLLVLLDDRFLTPKYRQLLPDEWRHFRLMN